MKNTNGNIFLGSNRVNNSSHHNIPPFRNTTTSNGHHIKLNNGHHHPMYHPEVNGNSPYRLHQQADKFEIPLPFGYHMDLDFLRFCSGELVSGETLERLKELRKQRRKQRKTLEALMGIRQEQRDKEKRSATMQPLKVTRAILPPPPDVVNTPEFIKEALKDAVQDFEQCLQQERSSDRSFISSTPNKCAKFNTFPRALSSPEEPTTTPTATSTFKMFRQSSNSSISSISTNSSALHPHQPNTDSLLAGLPSSVPPKLDQMETDSITSITSEMSTSTLKNIREQMARSLHKLKEYERQVEAIPVMQVKLSVLKEEKRLLMLKLKQRELQLRRERGEQMVDESDGGGIIDYDSEEEEEDDVMDEGQQQGRQRVALSMKHRFQQEMASRARSESPYARGGIINPDEFISVKKKRAASCGYNSDSDLLVPMSERKFFNISRQQQQPLSKSSPHHNLSTPHITERSEISFFTPGGRKTPAITKEASVNTDPIPKEEPPKPVVIKRSDRAVNTDKSPPPPRKINHGTNTVAARTLSKSTATLIPMDAVVTRDEMEARVQEAVFKTEEEIMGCPLLQKAMAKVEEEAMHGPIVARVSDVRTEDAGCQVGDDNLRPFVISVGLQCKLDDILPIVYRDDDNSRQSSVERRSRVLDMSMEKLVRSIGVGEDKVIEDPREPARFREIGICTEKWVEVIKASKQTDTEDFAFKDTESPRVADMVFEPSPERIVLERRSSLRRQSAGSPSLSRRSSNNSPVTSRKTSKVVTRSQGTMTPEVLTKDAKTGGTAVATKTVGTSALQLALPLGKINLPAPGSPLTTPEAERPKVNICDKCELDIHRAAEAGVTGARLQPPSPDMPWLSKIPRPVLPQLPENSDVFKLKAASSTDNLNRPRTPQAAMQRSKSNLTPTLGRKLVSPLMSASTRDVGTPPPHPSSPGGIRRGQQSPLLARSQSPYAQQQFPPQPSQEKRSLIPKLSPGVVRKASPLATAVEKSSETSSRSFLPRVTTPPALRKMYPKTPQDKLATPDRNVVRKNTFTKLTVGVANPELDESKTLTKLQEKEEEEKDDISSSSISSEDEKKPTPFLFAPIDENRKKAEPSKEMRAALKVLNDSLGKAGGVALRGNAQVTNAVNIVQQEWFRVSSTKQSSPLDVEEYLDAVEDISRELLARVVNLTDVNGNTALHYSVSHGNFDVVSVLLDSKVADTGVMNKAGYTCVMLISLAPIQGPTHRAVVSRLLSLSDVNVRATQHGQTALMLAVSHGREEMARLLVEAGADVNIRDEDGSTALMCAAEHGHMELVKFLLQQPETNVLAKDNDGLTALAVAMEAGHRDVGVVLYANMSFSRGASPYSSMRIKSPAVGTGGNTTPKPPVRNRRNSMDQ